MSAQNTRLARHKATQEVGNAVVLLEQYLCAEKKLYIHKVTKDG